MEKLSEIYRYMGIKNQSEISGVIKQRVSELLCLAKELSDFKYVYKSFDLAFEKDGIAFGDAFFLKSNALMKNLKTCKKAFVFIATLGMEFEKKLQFFSARQPSDALIFQAIGTELLEDFCDGLCNNTFLKDFPENYKTVPRFSPGYGDLSIDAQKDFFRILKPEKAIGVYLTDSLMMIPSKSVSAIAGISDCIYLKTKPACTSCGKKDCEFRIKENGNEY